MQAVKKSQYRQRVFLMSDGTIELVFGDDPVPPDSKLLADHDVVETAVVTDHVE